MSLSGLAGILCVMTGPYVGRSQFEFLLPFPMAAGVAVLEAAVLVRPWAVWAAPVQSSKASHPYPLVSMGGANARTSR